MSIMVRFLIYGFIIGLLNGNAYANINPFYSPIDKLEKLEKKLEEQKQKMESTPKKGEEEPVLSFEIVGVIKIGKTYVLEVKKGKEIKFYTEGDRLGNWKIRKVTFNSLVLVKGKEKQVIPIR